MHKYVHTPTQKQGKNVFFSLNKVVFSSVTSGDDLPIYGSPGEKEKKGDKRDWREGEKERKGEGQGYNI